MAKFNPFRIVLAGPKPFCDAIVQDAFAYVEDIAILSDEELQAVERIHTIVHLYDRTSVDSCFRSNVLAVRTHAEVYHLDVDNKEGFELFGSSDIIDVAIAADAFQKEQGEGKTKPVLAVLLGSFWKEMACYDKTLYRESVILKLKQLLQFLEFNAPVEYFYCFEGDRLYRKIGDYVSRFKIDELRYCPIYNFPDIKIAPPITADVAKRIVNRKGVIRDVTINFPRCDSAFYYSFPAHPDYWDYCSENGLPNPPPRIMRRDAKGELSYYAGDGWEFVPYKDVVRRVDGEKAITLMRNIVRRRNVSQQINEDELRTKDVLYFSNGEKLFRLKCNAKDRCLENLCCDDRMLWKRVRGCPDVLDFGPVYFELSERQEMERHAFDENHADFNVNEFFWDFDEELSSWLDMHPLTPFEAKELVIRQSVVPEVREMTVCLENDDYDCDGCIKSYKHIDTRECPDLRFYRKDDSNSWSVQSELWAVDAAGYAYCPVVDYRLRGDYGWAEYCDGMRFYGLEGLTEDAFPISEGEARELMAEIKRQNKGLTSCGVPYAILVGRYVWFDSQQRKLIMGTRDGRCFECDENLKPQNKLSALPCGIISVRKNEADVAAMFLQFEKISEGCDISNQADSIVRGLEGILRNCAKEMNESASSDSVPASLFKFLEKAGVKDGRLFVRILGGPLFELSFEVKENHEQEFGVKGMLRLEKDDIQVIPMHGKEALLRYVGLRNLANDECEVCKNRIAPREINF